MTSDQLTGIDRDGWGALALSLLAWAIRGTTSPFPFENLDPQHLPSLRERGIDSLFFFAAQEKSPVQSIYERVWKEQLRVTDAFQAAAQAEGIDCIALKGMPLARRFYGRALGCMSDTDLLVHRQDTLRAISILYEIGLRPLVYDQTCCRMKYRDIAEMAAIEAQHYELVGYNKSVPLELSPEEASVLPQLLRHSLRIIDGQPTAIIELDIHHGVATDLDCSEFFDRAVVLDDGKQMTLSDADHLWFGLSRLYAEVALHGKTSLRDFAYLGPLLSRGKVDWAVVVDVAHRMELRPALFYFLSFLNSFSGGVPPEVLHDLNPRLGLRFRDWGWQLGRLFDAIDPAPFN